MTSKEDKVQMVMKLVDETTPILKKIKEELADFETEANKPNGQFVFTIALMTKNGLQHATYQRYLTLYQEALLKQGIDLSSPVIPYTTN